ncbi:MAG: hypothetical protein QOK28_2875 [Actinomycetota bacterium]
MRRVLLVLAVITAALAPMLRVAPSSAAATTNLGGKATGFGSNGAARWRINRAPDDPHRVAVDMHGRIVFDSTVAVRPVRDANGKLVSLASPTAAFTRLLPSGATDTTFGVGGTRALAGIAAGYGLVLNAFELAPDDSVYALVFGAQMQALVLHVTNTGAVDTNFGSSGTGFAPVPYPTGWTPDDGGGQAIAVRPDGRVVVAYAADKSGVHGWRVFLGGVKADGSPDGAFGASGVVAPGGVSGVGYDYAFIRGLETRADGDLVLGLGTYDTLGAAMWVMQPGGLAEPGYGSAGHVEFGAQQPGDTGLAGFVLHPSGAVTASLPHALAQITAAGALDTAFGTNGSLAVPSSDIGDEMFADGPKTVRLDEYGLLERRMPDGSLDPSFGNGGEADWRNAVTRFGGTITIAARGGSSGQRRAVVLSRLGNADTGVLGLLGTGALDPQFGTGGLRRIDLGGFGFGGGFGNAAITDSAGGLWFDWYADYPMLVHFDANGKRLTSSPDGGAVLTEFSVVDALVGGPADTVTAVGWQTNAADAPSYVAVQRFLRDGAPDPSFNGGKVLLLPPSLNPTVTVTNIAAAKLVDGRIIVVTAGWGWLVTTSGVVEPTGGFATDVTGTVAVAPRGAGYVIAGVNGDVAPSDGPQITLRAQTSPGVDDATWGDGGTVHITDPRAKDQCVDGNGEVLRPTPNGLTLLTGGAMTRFHDDGSLDTSFNGPSGFSANFYSICDFAAQDDGALVVSLRGATRRYLADGTLDDSFGNHGTIALGLGLDTRWYSAHVAVSGHRLYFPGMVVVGNAVATDWHDAGVIARDTTVGGGAPVLSLDKNYAVWEHYKTSYGLPAHFDRPPDAPDYLGFTFASGTANVPGDAGYTNNQYASVNGYVPTTITPIPVHVVDDSEVEADETLSVHLVYSLAALIDSSNDTGTITIRDDDRQGSSSTVATRRLAAATTGAFVAAGDVDGDHRAEVIVGGDRGNAPIVRVLDGATLASKSGFVAYDSSFTGGVRVATADVDGDGRAEIITAPGRDGAPDVRVFRWTGSAWQQIAAFAPYASDMTAGVAVGAADVNGDGHDEIVTAPGSSGNATVRVWSVQANGSVSQTAGFTASASASTNGAWVAGFHLDGDNRDEIAVGAGAGGSPTVQVFHVIGTTATLAKSFTAYDPAFRGGVFVAGGRMSGYTAEEVVTAAGPGGGPHVAVNQFPPDARRVPYQFMAYEQTFAGGTRVAVGDVDADGRAELITAPGPGRAMDIIVRRVSL